MRIIDKLRIINKIELADYLEEVKKIDIDEESLLEIIPKDIWNALVLDNDEYSKLDIRTLLTQYTTKYIFDTEVDCKKAYSKMRRIVRYSGNSRKYIRYYIILFDYMNSISIEDIRAYSPKCIINKNLREGWLGIKVVRKKTEDGSSIYIKLTVDDKIIVEDTEPIKVINTQLAIGSMIQFKSIELKDNRIILELDYKKSYTQQYRTIRIDITDKLSNKVTELIKYCIKDWVGVGKRSNISWGD